MSDIKESSKKKEANSYLTVDSGDVIKQMEMEWPEMTAEFRRLQKEQYELFLHKQHDYGPGNISVGSPLLTEEDILMSNRTHAVQDEPMEDAYLDVSNYGIMATIVKNGKWGK